MAVVNQREHVSVQPSIEPITIDDARLHCDLDDSYFDGKLRQLIIAARNKVEQDTRLAFITQTRVLTFNDWPGTIDVELPTAPIQSVSSITYTDSNDSVQTLSASNYTVDAAHRPGRIVLNHGESWPSNRGHHNDITVTYIAGHGSATTDVPELAKLAMLLLIRHWFDHGTAVSMDFAPPKTMPMAYQSTVDGMHWGQYP